MKARNHRVVVGGKYTSDPKRIFISHDCKKKLSGRSMKLSSAQHLNGLQRLARLRTPILLMMAVLLGMATPARGRIELNVTRVGYATLDQAMVVRSGAWVPVIVDLALIDQPTFDGYVRIAQFDVDGDECFDQVEVHLREETGGTQRVYLYTPANPIKNQNRYRVELLNIENEAVEMVTQGELSYYAQSAQSPNVITDDEVLILSISSGAIGHVKDLMDVSADKAFTRPIRIAHMSTTDLPQLWIGLDMVDDVVWDDADPDDLTPPQLEALLTWVRHGGTLLIAASRTAGSVSMNPILERVLPVDLGEMISVNNLPQTREQLMGNPRMEGGRISEDLEKEDEEWFLKPYSSPVPVIRCQLREGATAIMVEEGVDLTLISRKSLGRGEIIFSGVTLKDLFSGKGEPAEFFQNMFTLSVEDNVDQAPARRLSLFNNVLNAVSFSTSSSLYLLAAFIFSILYLVIATGGTWWLLGRKGRRKHAWTAFAAVAIVASTLSVIIVGAIQGFGAKLHQISIVDVQPDDPYGQATVFFGVKVSSDQELDFWLPGDPISASEPMAANCSLKPLSPSNDPNENTRFADPQSYKIIPASAVALNVRIRATLKRFEGRWEGPLGGTFSGSVTIQNRMITNDSYVVNDLGVDLRDCCIIQTDLDFNDERKGFRSGGIYVYEIGDLPADRTRVMLAPRCYKPDGLNNLSEPSRPSLTSAHTAWSQPFQSILSSGSFFSETDIGVALGEEHKALLLLSTLGEYDPALHRSAIQWMGSAQSWSHDRLRQLDMQRDLRRDTLILIGLADDPGPMRLFTRTGDKPYRPLEPDPRKSWSMYRIKLPVTILDPPGLVESQE